MMIMDNHTNNSLSSLKSKFDDQSNDQPNQHTISLKITIFFSFTFLLNTFLLNTFLIHYPIP